MAKTKHAPQACGAVPDGPLLSGSRKVKELRPSTSIAATGYPFDPATTLIRMPELEALTGLARATIYKRLKDDPTFPRPVPLSDSTARGAPVAFVLGEVQGWIRGRIAARGGIAA